MDALQNRLDTERAVMVEYRNNYVNTKNQLSRRLLKINESHPELKCLEGFDGFEIRPADQCHRNPWFAMDDSTDESQQTTQESQESQASPVLTDGSQDEEPFTRESDAYQRLER
eukprot:SAG11_NODE_7320_length_1160_cov_118.809614_2_plen_114_part_00